MGLDISQLHAALKCYDSQEGNATFLIQDSAYSGRDITQSHRSLQGP